MINYVKCSNSKISIWIKNMDYEFGLTLAKLLLSNNYTTNFNVLDGRLKENLQREKLYGGNETTRSERAQIIDQLNTITINGLGIRFIDACNIEYDLKQDILMVLSAIESKKISENDIDIVLTAIRNNGNQLTQNGRVLSEVNKITSILNNPTLGLQNKLKLSLPLIPTILSYETEIELGGEFKLREVWLSFLGKIKK